MVLECVEEVHGVGEVWFERELMKEGREWE